MAWKRTGRCSADCCLAQQKLCAQAVACSWSDQVAPFAFASAANAACACNVCAIGNTKIIYLDCAALRLSRTDLARYASLNGSEPSKKVLRPVLQPSVPYSAGAGAAVYWSLGTVPTSRGCAKVELSSMTPNASLHMPARLLPSANRGPAKVRTSVRRTACVYSTTMLDQYSSCV